MAFTYTFPNTEIEFRNLENIPASGQWGTKNGINNDFEHADEDGIAPFVNAVEIDWNSAIIGEG